MGDCVLMFVHVFTDTTLFELRGLIQRTLSVVHGRRMDHALFCNILSIWEQRNGTVAYWEGFVNSFE